MSDRIIVLYIGAERPGCRLFWTDDNGAAVDLSAYSSFTVSLLQNGTTTTLSGATVTANASPTTRTGSASDVPTLSVSFTSGALDSISAGAGVLKVDATSGTTNRRGEWDVEVRP